MVSRIILCSGNVDGNVSLTSLQLMLIHTNALWGGLHTPYLLLSNNNNNYSYFQN